MPRVLSPEDIPGLIPGDVSVFIQGGVGEPLSLLNALVAASASNKVVNYTGVSIPGINRFSPHRFHPGARFHSFFVHAGIASANDPSLLFHPMHYRDVYRYLRLQKPFDIALIQVSPPDARGNCSLGVSVDFVPAILDRCNCVVAEINAAMPATANGPTIAYQDIDIAVMADHPLPIARTEPGGETEAAIAGHVAALIDDGSCLQIGIGKLPGSILKALHHHRRLGLHSGLISSDARGLIEAGVITGENKSLDRKQHVTGLALGDGAFYRWIADQSEVVFRPVDYTHDIRSIGAIEQFVAINSVLELDLLGNANAEKIAGRTVSSSGGLVDFVRGARASRGGKSILALPATAMKGSRSRIVARLGADGISTLVRTDIDHVVTEYGSAALFTLGTQERARALVDIAAPQHRDQLWDDWEEGCRQGNSKRV